MKIAIETECGCIACPVYNSDGELAGEDAAWIDALSTFLTALQGLGYHYGCDIDTIVDAAVDVHHKALERK